MRGQNPDDRKAFTEVRTALKITEFSEDEQTDMFNIIASVLNLGNTGFSETEGKAHITKTEGVEAVSKVLNFFFKYEDSMNYIFGSFLDAKLKNLKTL